MSFAGWTERWGTGTTRIVGLCRQQGLPEPEFRSQSGRFEVLFLKDPYTEDRLRAMGLSERQIKAVAWLKKQERITNGDYENLSRVSERTATTDLSDLVSRGALEQTGTTGRGAGYVLMPPE